MTVASTALRLASGLLTTLALLASSVQAGSFEISTSPFGCFPRPGARVLRSGLVIDRRFPRPMPMALLIVESEGREQAWTYQLPMGAYYGQGASGDVLRYQDRSFTFHHIAFEPDEVPPSPEPILLELAPSVTVRMEESGGATVVFDPEVVAAHHERTVGADQQRFRELHTPAD